MRDQSNETEAGRHQNVWELLPWYVNGTLTDPERSVVTYHVSSCQICQGEVVRCQSIAAAVRSDEETEWTPSEHLARLMARLNHETISPVPEGWWTRVHQWL